MKHCIFLLGLCLFIGCSKGAAPTQPGQHQGNAAGNGKGAGEGDTGRNAILQVPFDNVAKLVMTNIGKAYQLVTVAQGKPPRDAVELDAGALKTKRDMQDREVEVLFGVDPKRLNGDPAEYMLAWEKTPTNDGKRMVLMADFTTVKYVGQDEFDRMKKAK